MGPADRPGAVQPVGGGPPGGVDPAAGRPRLPVVAERRRGDRAGDRARFPDLVAALGGPSGGRPHPPGADGLHRQGAPRPEPRAAPLGDQVPVRVRRRSAERRRHDRARGERQGADHGPRRGNARRRDRLGRGQADPHRIGRGPVLGTAHPDRRHRRPDRGVAARRRRAARQGDNWIIRGAQHLVTQYGTEITAIITETIERWDADEASRRIELHVGRDLQFIRINGTVVGALAGLVIYTVAQLLFG